MEKRDEEIRKMSFIDFRYDWSKCLGGKGL